MGPDHKVSAAAAAVAAASAAPLQALERLRLPSIEAGRAVAAPVSYIDLKVLARVAALCAGHVVVLVVVDEPG